MFKPLHRKNSGNVAVLAFLLVLLAFSLFVWFKKQDIYDWTRLRNYTPPDEIAQLAFDTTMNNDARQLFYVYHPELNNREQFNQNCSGFGEHTIVLGCYVSNLGIYLFDVDDERLEGVEQVTAAHELLHAAYDRLDDDERARVDKMTANALKNLSDERIKRTIENYRQRDASVVPNELHSILGTEVRGLPPELEDYYKQYFNNRHAIVAFSEKYESVLTQRRDRAAALEVQISGLRNEIELKEQMLETERNRLQADRDKVDSRQEAAAYNARVADYNAGIGELNQLIAQHNALIEEYKKIAVESKELHEALDSRPTL